MLPAITLRRMSLHHGQVGCKECQSGWSQGVAVGRQCSGGGANQKKQGSGSTQQAVWSKEKAGGNEEGWV